MVVGEDAPLTVVGATYLRYREDGMGTSWLEYIGCPPVAASHAKTFKQINEKKRSEYLEVVISFYLLVPNYT